MSTVYSTHPLPPRRPGLGPWPVIGIVLGSAMLVWCAGIAIFAAATGGPKDGGRRSTENIGAAAPAAQPDAGASTPQPAAVPASAKASPAPSPTTTRPRPSSTSTQPRPAPSTTKPKPKPTPTKPKPSPAASCHPNYTGACVPFASDVDCAGGSGNGPAYVRGPVYIRGADPYRLDNDGDGVACEP